MAATVGELNIKLNMELARLESQIKQANSKVSKAGGDWNGSIGKAAKMINGTLATIGVGASLSGLVAFGKQCLDLGGQIVDLSAQAGLGTDAFQALRLAAMENGSTGEEVAASFAKMNRSMQEAIEGGKSQVEAFDKLNLSAEYLKTLAPEKRFELIARAVIGAKDSQQAYNAAADIFGAKIGPKLNQLLTALATQGYDKIAEGNKKMTLTPEQLKTLDDAGDKLARLWELTKLTGAQGIVGFAKAMDPELDMVEARLKMLEELRARGQKTYELNGQTGDVETAYANFTKMRDRMRGITPVEVKPVELSADTSTIELEKKAQATAEAERSDIAYAEVMKQLDKDEIARGKIYDASVKKITDREKALMATADAARQAISPSYGLAKRIGEINAAADAGVLSLGDATAAIKELKKSAVDAELDSFFGEMDKKSTDNMKALNKEAKLMANLADDIGDSFGSAFEDAVLGGDKLRDVVKGLGKDILALVFRQQVTAPLASGISSLIGGIFGGARAAGGPVEPGKVYMVGEKGPEPFIPKSAGTILPNSSLAGARSSGGDAVSITIHQVFQAGVSQSQLAEGLRQTYEASKSGVMDAIQRRRGGFGALAT